MAVVQHETILGILVANRHHSLKRSRDDKHWLGKAGLAGLVRWSQSKTTGRHGAPVALPEHGDLPTYPLNKHLRPPPEDNREGGIDLGMCKNQTGSAHRLRSLSDLSDVLDPWHALDG